MYRIENIEFFESLCTTR